MPAIIKTKQMKKCLSLILSFCLFASSCTNFDSTNSEIPSSDDKNLIKKEFYLKKQIESNSYVTSDYDQNGQVSKRSTVRGDGSGFSYPITFPNEFIYNSEGKLIETNFENFEYDDFGRVKTRYDKRNSVTEEVTYKNNIIEINSYYTRTFKLDSKNRIVEFRDGINSPLDYTMKIEYDAFDNIKKIENIPTVTNSYSIKEIIEMEYDKYPNPFYNSFKTWSDASKLFQFEYSTNRFSWWAIFAYFSKNNVTSYKYTQKQYDNSIGGYGEDLPLSEVFRINYSYNNNEYPTDIKIESIFTYSQYPPLEKSEVARLEY